MSLKTRPQQSGFDAWRKSCAGKSNRPKRWVVFACHYLEKQGYRFAIDFGTANAISKAADHMCKLLEPPYGK